MKSLYVHIVQLPIRTTLTDMLQVAGNDVDGVAIAGQVQISQYLLEANSGLITSVGYDGKLTLEDGQVVRINDPNAVFSAGYKLHPACTADDQNPSVTSESARWFWVD